MLQYDSSIIQCSEIKVSNNIQSRFQTRHMKPTAFFFFACQHASKKKAPKIKLNPKHKLHKLDNWKVAHVFMRQVGIRVRDFEPAGKLHVHVYTHSCMAHTSILMPQGKGEIYALKGCVVPERILQLEIVEQHWNVVLREL